MKKSPFHLLSPCRLLRLRNILQNCYGKREGEVSFSVVMFFFFLAKIQDTPNRQCTSAEDARKTTEDVVFAKCYRKIEKTPLWFSLESNTQLFILIFYGYFYFYIKNFTLISNLTSCVNIFKTSTISCAGQVRALAVHGVRFT